VSKIRVLFLCVHNTVRSQMAEAFLRAFAGDEFEVYSAGLEPREIDPLAVAVMRERGFDLQGHYAKPLSEFLGKVHFGYLITVCDRAARGCPTFPGMGTRLNWSFEDPAAFRGTEQQPLAKFREVPDGLELSIREWLVFRGGW
jgi:arsenate reductase